MVLASLLAGTVLTLLFTAQMGWKQLGDCSDSSLVRSPHIGRVDCSSLAYGYPYRFIYSRPSLDINYLIPDRSSPVLLGINSVIKVDGAKLAADLTFWSVASLGVVLFFNIGNRRKH